MTRYDLEGPYTGAALRPHPPYAIQRRRALAARLVIALAIMVMICAGLWGVNHG